MGQVLALISLEDRRFNLTVSLCVEACGACSGAAKEDQAPTAPTAQYTFEGPVGSELHLMSSVFVFWISVTHKPVHDYEPSPAVCWVEVQQPSAQAAHAAFHLFQPEVTIN